MCVSCEGACTTAGGHWLSDSYADVCAKTGEFDEGALAAGSSLPGSLPLCVAVVLALEGKGPPSPVCFPVASVDLAVAGLAAGASLPGSLPLCAAVALALEGKAPPPPVFGCCPAASVDLPVAGLAAGASLPGSLPLCVAVALALEGKAPLPPVFGCFPVAGVDLPVAGLEGPTCFFISSARCLLYASRSSLTRASCRWMALPSVSFCASPFVRC